MIQTDNNRFVGLGEPKEFVDVVLSQFPDPFGKVTGDKRAKVARKIGLRAERQFRRLMARLERLVKRCEPTRTLAHFEVYDCTFFERQKAADYEPIEQFGIELLQAMFLSFPQETYPADEPRSKTLLKLNEVIRRLGPAYSLRGLGKNQSNEDRLKEADILSHQVQMHTFGIRNAGYQNQLVSQLRGLFTPLDSEYFTRTGVKLSPLITMWERLVKLVEQRFNERFQQLRAALPATSPEEVITKYCEARGFDDAYRTSMMREMLRHRADVDTARKYCVQDSNRTTFHYYLLTTEDFVAAYPDAVAADKLRKVIERWAFRPGSLVGANREHFLLSNPIWDRPLIHLRPDQFYWPIIQIFHSFGLEMLERLVGEFPDLVQSYEQRIRPQFLERRVTEELGKALPTAEVLQGVEWIDPATGRKYETDHLVMIDAIAVVVESKAGRITQSARRGAPERLRREIRKLIEDASVQSARLVEAIGKSDSPVTLRLRDGTTRQLNPRSLRRLVRLNVTLDFFGPLACEVRSMQAARLLDPAVAGAPTLALVDLENLCVLLEKPAQFLHYLARRAQLEQNLDWFTDELDLMALYLGTGFALGEFEVQKEQRVSFYGLSKQIEPFLFSKSAGINVIKPRRKLTPFWQSLLDAFESRRFPNWTVASLALLDVGYEGQQDFEKQQDEMCERIRTTNQREGEINTIIAINGHSQKRSAIVSVGVREISDAERKATMQHAVKSAMDHGQCEEVLIITQRVHRRDGPYFTAGLSVPATERSAVSDQ